MQRVIGNSKFYQYLVCTTQLCFISAIPYCCSSSLSLKGKHCSTEQHQKEKLSHERILGRQKFILKNSCKCPAIHKKCCRNEFCSLKRTIHIQWSIKTVDIYIHTVRLVKSNWIYCHVSLPGLLIYSFCWIILIGLRKQIWNAL